MSRSASGATSADAAVGVADDSASAVPRTLQSAATSDSGFDGAMDESQSIVERNESTPIPAGSSTSSIGVINSSLGAGVEGLVLYDLTNAKGSAKVFSPHCIKTVMDLRLLGIGYDRQRLTFVQVRTQLAGRLGDNAVTVPTLELSNGTHLSDSWIIATYLAEHHAHGAKLFPNPPCSRAFAASLNAWGKCSMAPHLRPLTRPSISAHLDAESAAYFEEKKVGKVNMDKFRALSDEQRRRHVQACIDALEPIQDALAAVREATAGGPYWLEGGKEPSHADFCVYGWYVHTRVGGMALSREIWHAHPLVAGWVKSLNTWAGEEITTDFFA